MEKEVTKIVEVKGASAKQAPDLAEMVKAGTLPPLDERLPKNPKVLTKSRNEIPQGDLDLTIGKYGGTIRTTQPSPNWQPDLFVATDEPLCAAPGILAEGIGGGVAESFEVEDGGRTFTFHLRPGHKVVGRRAGDHRGRPVHVRGRALERRAHPHLPGVDEDRQLGRRRPAGRRDRSTPIPLTSSSPSPTPVSRPSWPSPSGRATPS